PPNLRHSPKVKIRIRNIRMWRFTLIIVLCIVLE
ncbi:unnamed protein product, partial [marine sediment metagenome]